MTNDGGLEGLLVTKLEVMPPASARGQVGALDGNVLFFSKLMEISAAEYSGRRGHESDESEFDGNFAK